jgi:SAM-dependent methyltransferase
MPLHRKAAKAKWDSAFAQPGFVCLRPREVELLTRVGVKGKSVAHLCCNNGIELMSLKNLGAATCVGFDISDEAIKDAQERARLCSIDCLFVRTDVYDIAPDYNDLFDMIYLTTGGLGWLPDLRRLFARAATLLRPSGVVFIHDIHPFFEMLPADGAATGDPLRIAGPYFKPEPYVDYGGLDYVGGEQYTGHAAQYWFVHTLSDILMGLIANRLCLEHFCEYPEAVSPHQQPAEQRNAGVPLSYMLVARKDNRS